MCTMSTINRCFAVLSPQRRQRRLRFFAAAQLVAISLAAAAPAHAIPPPDFVINAGMQIAQAIGVAAFFCSTGSAYLYRRFRSSLNSPAWRLAIIILILGGFLLSCYLVWSF